MLGRAGLQIIRFLHKPALQLLCLTVTDNHSLATKQVQFTLTFVQITHDDMLSRITQTPSLRNYKPPFTGDCQQLAIIEKAQHSVLGSDDHG